MNDPASNSSEVPSTIAAIMVYNRCWEDNVEAEEGSQPSVPLGDARVSDLASCKPRRGGGC